MAGNCGTCNESVLDEKSGIKCSECDSSFHAACCSVKSVTALNKLSASQRKKWKCEKCKATPASSVASETATPLTQESLQRMLNSFKEEMMKMWEKKNDELATSVKFLSDSVDESNKIMRELKADLKAAKKKAEELQEARNQDRALIRELHVKVRQLEQYSRRENVEISGIPETQGENVLAVVKDVARVLEVDMDRNSVVAAHRVPSFNKKKTPSIIVRFTTREHRDTWISQYRSKKGSTLAKKVNPAFPNTNFYVSEHLTPEMKVLLGKTKKYCQNVNFKYVWVKEGKIFVREDENKKCVKIEDESDLERLK